MSGPFDHSLDLEEIAREAQRQQEMSQGDSLPPTPVLFGVKSEDDQETLLVVPGLAGVGAERWWRLCARDGADFGPLKAHPELVSLLAARTAPQKAYVRANMAMPTLTMAACLYGFGSAWAAVVAFHLISCILMPSAYVVACAGLDGAARLYAAFFVDLRSQLTWGAFYFVWVGAVGLLLYRALRDFVPPDTTPLIELGITPDPTTLLLFSLYFSVVNPVLEELFWRGFLSLVLGAGERHLLAASAAYALYHGLVLLAIGIDPAVAAALVVGLGLVGRVMSEMYRRTGLASGVLAHM
eukprot:CAMPEP_0114146768 /NCGR_PEP_ID=MMETSP0043_2-20121206/20742_1 /TAXON_ID=464988 /ORGANISM="Hemiselmis andersenii, Strain CCMP644" /LENGTH=296 /DNA_ID=CAMNT_0001241247 /DNA_START=194 /DNA_END=1082 /DNA_ORIENTATION=+